LIAQKCFWVERLSQNRNNGLKNFNFLVEKFT
jgi:hypothetical protein